MTNKRTRRPNGAGSVRRRSDGKGYDARLRLPNGRRLTKKVATEREGRSVLADWKKRYHEYTAPVAAPVPRPELTHELPELNAVFLMERLGELLAADERLGRIRPKTRADMLSTARCSVLPALDGRPPLDSPEAVTQAAAALDASLVGRGLGVHSRRHAALVLRRMLRAAGRAEWEACVPVPRDNAAAEAAAAPTTERVRAMLAEAAADDHPAALLVLLGAVTGARRGELTAARWEDITPSGGWTVRRSATPYGVKATKTGRVRSVPLTPAVMARLAEARERSVSEWLAADPRDPERYLHPESLSAYYRRLATRHGAPGGMHSLRRCAATRMLEKADMDAAAALLGHADLATTRRYLTARNERVREGVLAFAADLDAA